MSNQFKVMLAGWVVLGLVVIALAIYRKMLAKQDDISLHVLDSSAGLIGQQANQTQKIDMIEKWGKALTAVELVYGLGLAAMYIYAVWVINQSTFYSDK